VKCDSPTFSADVVKQFFADFEAGKLDKHVRSQDEPKNNDGPVKVLTGRNFEKLVSSGEKDALVEFYAPWCGHCKALEPKWEELGKKVKAKHPDVLIGKMDATANAYPTDLFQVSGYPTIYFAPAKKGAKPIKYEGEREVDAMYKFLKKKSKAIKKQLKKQNDADDDDDDDDE